jgi:hypothetical protein
MTVEEVVQKANRRFEPIELLQHPTLKAPMELLTEKGRAEHHTHTTDRVTLRVMAAAVRLCCRPTSRGSAAEKKRSIERRVGGSHAGNLTRVLSKREWKRITRGEKRT